MDFLGEMGLQHLSAHLDQNKPVRSFVLLPIPTVDAIRAEYNQSASDGRRIEER